LTVPVHWHLAALAQEVRADLSADDADPLRGWTRVVVGIGAMKVEIVDRQQRGADKLACPSLLSLAVRGDRAMAPVGGSPTRGLLLLTPSDESADVSF